jgi:hypothetical protein
MPPSDYLNDVTCATVAAVGFRGWLRTLWSRIRHRGPDSFEGHRVDWREN